MNRGISILIFVIFILIGLFVLNLSLESSAQANQSTPVSMPAICINHGGVNCTILNPDALAVCNDGAIEQSTLIYAVPECQKNIENLADQQSNFMAQTGCYPPSEMGCFGEQSYQGLYKILTASGLANSKLGKDELAQCRQQIQDYQTKNYIYKQCLLKNNNSGFSLPGDMLIKPLLKMLFCPIFYGENTSYNYDADMCICDKGYFMYNNSCTDASLICQAKYGPNIYAQGGDCKRPAPIVSVPIKTEVGMTPIPPVYPTFTPVQQDTTYNPYTSNTPTPNTLKSESLPLTTEHTSSYLEKILDYITSGLKNILRLFL